MQISHKRQSTLPSSRAKQPLLKWLTHIPDSLSPSLQRRANLLAWLLLFMMMILLLTTLIVFLVNPASAVRRLTYGGLISVFLVFVVAAFLLNRYGYYRPAAGITLTFAFLAPWLSAWLDPTIMQGDFVPLNYVLLPILLSSFLLRPFFTILFSFIQVVALLMVALLTSAKETINWPSLMIFVFFASVFIIIHNVIGDRDMAQIDQQNEQLRSSSALLREETIRDPLTTLFNRRYLMETLEREIRRAEREQSPVGMIMIDLDQFKEFNDTHGHPAGDVHLREFGLLLKRQIREADIACRYGGEEFVLLMPGAPLEITCLRAEQLLERVRGLQVEYLGETLASITISAGVANFPQHGSSGQEVLAAADVALYRAKAAGRDQVVVAASNPGSV